MRVHPSVVFHPRYVSHLRQLVFGPDRRLGRREWIQQTHQNKPSWRLVHHAGK